MGNGDKDTGKKNISNNEISAPSFTSLILSISSSAWIGLGKIIDPITGKLKVDLDGAKYSIDTLIMLREKTKGNLTEDEQRLLNGIIADLQANYAETVFSSGKEKDKGTSEKGEGEPDKNKSGKKESSGETVKTDDKVKEEAGESVKKDAKPKAAAEKEAGKKGTDKKTEKDKNK